jgi:hypothetical protein
MHPASSQTVKPFTEMPTPPSWPFIGHLPLFAKNKLRMDKMFQALREEYGDIYKLHVPGGLGSLVVLFRPEDIMKLHTSDGRIPHIQGFEFFEFVRKTTMKDR